MSSSLHMTWDTPTPLAQEDGSNIPAFFDAVGKIRSIFPSGPSSLIFAQGDPANEVFHIQEGTVKKSVLSRDGRDAVVAVLGPGDFFGEECLAGQPLRMATASALTEGALLVIEKREMFRLLHGSARSRTGFVATLPVSAASRTASCNPGEKRLARASITRSLRKERRAAQDSRSYRCARRDGGDHPVSRQLFPE